MASFGQSQYGKFASFQNNSGSADAAAPEGGVYLFASGALGNSKLYLQNEGQSSLIDLDSVLDIAGDSGQGTVSNSQTLTIAGGTGLDTSAADQTITFSLDLNELGAAAVDVAADSLAIVDATDNSTKKESIADLMTAAAGNGLAASSGVLAVGVDDTGIEIDSDALRLKDNGVTLAKMAGLAAANFILGDSNGDPAAVAMSGDVTLSNAGVATIGAQKVLNSMLADDAVDSDELAAGAVDLAHMSANSVDSDQYVDGSIDTAHIADAQITLAKMAANSVDSDQYVDGSIDNAHIAADAVDGAKIADDAVNSEHIALGALDSEHYASGSIQTGHVADNQVTLAKMAGLAAAKFILGDSNGDPAAVTMSGDVTLSNAGVASIGATKVTDAMMNDDVATGLAGAGLAASSGVLAVDFDELSAKTTVVDADLAVIIDSEDSNASKKMTRGNLLGSALAAFSNGLTATTMSASSNVSVGGSVLLGGSGGGIANAAGQAVMGVSGQDATFASGIGVTSGATFGGGYGSSGVTISDSGALQLNASLTVDTSATFGGGYGSTGATISAAGALQLNSGLTVDDAATFGGGYGSTGVTISNAGAIQANGAMQLDGTFTQGADGAGVDAKFFGGDADEYMLYDASANHLQFQSSDDALILEIGASSNGYAIEVNSALSGDAGKIKANAFVTYSDENLKKEVTAMDTALDTVMSLEGVEFTWKDSGERDFGFLAQQVKSVIPQAVSVGNDGVHGVDYSRLTSVLVEAVKAQQVQIDDLKKALKK
jgi:hypothetical protein